MGADSLILYCWNIYSKPPNSKLFFLSLKYAEAGCFCFFYLDLICLLDLLTNLLIIQCIMNTSSINKPTWHSGHRYRVMLSNYRLSHWAHAHTQTKRFICTTLCLHCSYLSSNKKHSATVGVKVLTDRLCKRTGCYVCVCSGKSISILHFCCNYA